MNSEKDIVKVVMAEDVDDAIEAIMEANLKTGEWIPGEPRVESAAGGKIKITIHFTKK